MTHMRYLLDTHALIFWANKSAVSAEFIRFFDEQNQLKALFVSTIAFWEIALLVQKGKLVIADLHGWTDELLENTDLQLLEPSVREMIESTWLPPHHNDPFDRLLIAQAKHHNLTIVTQNRVIPTYPVTHIWL